MNFDEEFRNETHKLHGDANVVPFKRKINDIILPSEASIQGRVYVIPTLIWHDHLDEWVSDYLRYLVVIRKQAYSSAEEVAKKLRIFRRIQRAQGLAYDRVNDDVLLAWQNTMTNADTELRRRNDCISTVYNFFVWAETQGRLKNHVQLASKHEYADDMRDYDFPISSSQILTNGPHGQTYIRWVSTLIEPGNHSSYGMRHTPTPIEIERLFLRTESHARNSARNSLIMSWPLETGARVSEVLQVKISDLPSEAELGDLWGDDGPRYVEITVLRKNRGPSQLRVPADLVLRTLDFAYHDEERAKIVATRVRKMSGEEDFVFLSEKGGVLTTDSATRICGKFFREAEIEKANIHRLRARYITEVIERQLDLLAETGQSVDSTSSWQETILTMAQQLMGHTHLVSLRPYLNEILQRRITKDGKIEPRSTESRERSLQQLTRQLGKRIKHSGDLATADRLLGEGKFLDAASMLRQIANSLEQIGN